MEAGPIKAKKAKGDAISIDSSVSLREFESLEQACKEAAKIEKKAKEQEEVLSEIEEGHESQSESADTLSHDDQRSEDDNSDDFEERMFEIDEIIKQAQTNVEQFGESEAGPKPGLPETRPDMLPLEEIIGRSDSRTESTGVDKTATPDSEDSLEAPDLPATEAAAAVAAAAAGQLMQTSVDSLELNKRHVVFEEDVMQTSADSLELNKSGGAAAAAAAMMAMSTDSIEGDRSRKQAAAAMMEQSTDSLEGNGRAATAAATATDANIDARLGNGAKAAAIMEASTDSLEDARTATSAAAAASEDTVDVTHGGPVSIGHSVTEVIRASQDDFGHVVERTVEQPADVSRVVFRGPNSDVKLADYLSNLGAYETVQETEYVDSRTGCAVTKKVVSQRKTICGVDEQTVEEYDEFGNVKKFVLRSTSVPETVEVCRTIELISERPTRAETHQASTVVTTEYREAYRHPQSRQIAGIFGCTQCKFFAHLFFATHTQLKFQFLEFHDVFLMYVKHLTPT